MDSNIKSELLPVLRVPVRNRVENSSAAFPAAAPFDERDQVRERGKPSELRNRDPFKLAFVRCNRRDLPVNLAAKK